MKKTLLSSLFFSLCAIGIHAQTYTPAAGSALPNGEQGVAYAGQTINAAFPSVVNVTGQQILDQLPQGVIDFLNNSGTTINSSQSYPMNLTSVTLTVFGLPVGLSDDCNGCVVNGGSDVDILISGTPTNVENALIYIHTVSTGEVTIQGVTFPFGGDFDTGVPFAPLIPIPTLPGAFNAEDYTMSVSDPNGIEEANEKFSLGIYPNPADGISTLEVNSTVTGNATIEIYSITGSMIQTSVRTIRIGANRLNLDLTAVPAGIYLVKADISGIQALVRMQKK